MTTRSTENKMSLRFLESTTSCQILSSNKLPTDKLVDIPEPKIKHNQNLDINYINNITNYLNQY